MRRFRSFPQGADVERREAEGAPPVLVGYAAVFDSWTTLYSSKWMEYREVIRPGAFRNALAEKQDVRALFNHDPNIILGRTTAGTLRLSEDARGLAVEIDPAPTTGGLDAVISIGRGDVTQMSFAFTPRSDGERQTIRTVDDLQVIENEILDVDLFDVAPVTYPAYKDTEVALRVADFARRANARRVQELCRQFDALIGRAVGRV